MDLSADQRQQLQEALLSAFPGKAALAQMVSFGLNANLDNLALGDSTTEIIFKLIGWAVAQGRTADLIRGAYRENAGNPALAALVKVLNLLPSPLDPVAAAAPTAAGPGNPFYGDSPQMLGRAREIRLLLERLPANHCSIVGPPGSGKTTLLRTVLSQVPARLGWTDAMILRIGFRTIDKLNDLQMVIVSTLGGTRVAELRRLLTPRPLRLLALDDLGSMGTGADGYEMRRLLRGWAEEYAIRLLITSNAKLDVLFQDDSTRDSPFANLDPAPLQLPLLSLEDCRALVSQRLAGTRYSLSDFAEVLIAPQQPRDLLRLCAQRYETLRGGV